MRAGRRNILHSLVLCPAISGLICGTCVEGVQLSAECMLKITSSSALSKEGVACLFSTVAVLKECIWSTEMKGVMTGTFISVYGIVYYFRYYLKSKIELEGRHLSRRKLEKKLGVNDLSLKKYEDCRLQPVDSPAKMLKLFTL